MAGEILETLESYFDTDMPTMSWVRDKLNELADAVKAGGPEVREQVLALNAYKIVLRAWYLLCYAGVPTVVLLTPDAGAIREASLKALYTLTAGSPEIIDQVGWILIQQAIDIRLPDTTLALAMKVIRNICIKCEENREYISWELDMMNPLVLLIKRDKPSGEFVRAWCGAMKALTLSDDNRIVYNRAPERKRMIYQLQALPVLSRHLQTYAEDETTLNTLVVLIGTMAVNEDYCISIESGNILPSIVNIFKTAPQNKMLIKNSLSLLRYLNVSQTVRDKCASYGLVKLVLQLMLQYKNSSDVLEVGMSCLAFMTLRNACQASQFLAASGVSILLPLISQSLENIHTMKGACLTLRNVAASGGSDAKMKILEFGSEQTIREILEKFPDLRENYVKPALRDLAVWTAEDEISQLGTDPSSGELHTNRSASE